MFLNREKTKEMKQEELRYGKIRKRTARHYARYLETHDLDSAQSPLKYDLHKYASYLEKHHLDAKNVKPEILEQFRIK